MALYDVRRTILVPIANTATPKADGEADGWVGFGGRSCWDRCENMLKLYNTADAWWFSSFFVLHILWYGVPWGFDPPGQCRVAWSFEIEIATDSGHQKGVFLGMVTVFNEDMQIGSDGGIHDRWSEFCVGTDNALLKSHWFSMLPQNFNDFSSFEAECAPIWHAACLRNCSYVLSSPFEESVLSRWIALGFVETLLQWNRHKSTTSFKSSGYFLAGSWNCDHGFADCMFGQFPLRGTCFGSQSQVHGVLISLKFGMLFVGIPWAHFPHVWVVLPVSSMRSWWEKICIK